MPTLRVVLSLVAVSCLLPAGCGPGLEEFPVARAEGVVMCGMTPVADVMVFLEPLAGGSSSAIVGKPAMGLTDETGAFRLSTYGDEDGAVIGRHRVRVAPRSPQPDCPCVINDNVDVSEVEVQDTDLNHFDVFLKKRTARDPANTFDEDE